MLCFKFEVAGQVHSLGLFVPVQAVPWAYEAEQELSRVAPSVWDLCGDVCTFGAGLQQVSGRDPDAMFDV